MLNLIQLIFTYNVASLCHVWRRMCFPCFVLCVVFVCVNDVNSEKLQCEERHILNSEERGGLFNSKCSADGLGPKLNSSICTLWDFGEREPAEVDNDCSKLKFSSSSQAYIRKTQIVPYTPSIYDPNVNITFKNIDWNYMQYRMKIGNSNTCHKLKFNGSWKKLEDLNIWFACHTFGSWAQGYDAEILLDTGQSESEITAHAHYVLKVPERGSRVNASFIESIRDWIIVIVIDISHKPNLVIYWPVVPPKFNVTEYTVQVAGDEPTIVSETSCADGFCSLDYFAGYTSRNITVFVQPVHIDCQDSCYSSSPLISLDLYIPSYFMVMMLIVPVLLLVIIICCLYNFCCAAPREPPQVLILCDATERQHCRVVRLLAEYMSLTGHLECLLPDEEIPRFPSKNQLEWLQQTLSKVATVLIVASPWSHLPIRYSEYPQILYKALPLIKEDKKGSPYHRSRQVLVAVPPYCTEENIPECLRDSPSFAIPNDLSWLIWTIYNQNSWVAPFSYIVKMYLKWGWCPGPLFAWRHRGSRLQEALNGAQAAHLLVEQAPLTPLGSRRTSWTYMDPRIPQDETNDSTLSGNYFININKLPLLGLSVRSEGSIASEGIKANEVTKEGCNTLDALDL